MRIEVSKNEYDTHKLHNETLKTAVRAIYVDGYVILGGVVDRAVLDEMRAKLDEDTTELCRRIDSASIDHRLWHLSQAMPRTKEHIYSDIVTNSLVVQVTVAMLGEGVHNHFYNCNTNLPGSPRQQLHRDAPLLELDPVNPIISIIVNVSPIDVNEANGATELWPGTHRMPGSTLVSEEAEASRRDVVPPVRAVSRKGDVVLRDPRMWHRAMPNTSPDIRHMIAMVHSKRYYHSKTTIPVTRGAMHSFYHEVLTTRVEIVPDDYDYLSEIVRGSSY